MNVAGKSLQDIYDAGSRRLEELEKAQTGQLGDTGKTHLDEKLEAEPAALKQLEDRANALEEEIRAYLSQGVDRVQKVVSSECSQSERYIQRLVDGLNILAKKFSESIGQLRETAESQLDDLAKDNEQLYKDAAQAVTSHVNHEGVVAVDGCRAEATQAFQGTHGKLEESWNAIMDAEDEAVDDLLSAFESNSDQLAQTFQDCKKLIEGRLADKLSTLESRSAKANHTIKSTVDRVMEEADRHAFDSDVKLKEHFSSLLYETSTSYDDSGSRAINELVSLHESSMVDLTMKTQELSREMDSLAAAVVDAANDKSTELSEKVTGITTNYTGDLDKRLEQSKVFLDELEKERSELVSEIWRELSDVRQRFDDRLAKLAKNTLDKMHSICNEAESAIINAQHACAAESKQHAGEKQNAIEQSAHGFIDRIVKTRDHALEAIAKAAGASSEELAESETPAEQESPPAEATSSEDSPAGEVAIEEKVDQSAESVNEEADGDAQSSEEPAKATSEPRRRKKKDKRGEGKK